MPPEPCQDDVLSEIRSDIKGIVAQLSAASTASAVLSERFNSLDVRVGNMAGKVDGLPSLVERFNAAEKALASIEPKIEKLENWKAWVLGIGTAAAAVAGAMSGHVARLLGGN